MFDLDRWTEIWVTITRNKVRSLLTCFGVFWGILMLILLLGSGNGMKNGMFSNIAGFATNSAFFYSGRTSEPYKGYKKGRWWNMRNRDIENIIREVDGIEDLSPMLWGNRTNRNVVYGQRNGTYSIKGVYPSYFNIETQELHGGRLLNEIDLRERRKVCNIGTRVQEVLFAPGEDPLGKYIKVNGLYYQVIGVIKQKAQGVNLNGRSEESVMIPFSTLQQTLNQGDIAHFLAVTAKQGQSLEPIIKQISDILKRQNEIAPNDLQAVGVMDISKQFKTFDVMFFGIDVLVWFVGIMTLIAGVIGVSNIMMVTVRERTKEIGIRRALGAKPWNIISQVMSESLLLTAMAGLAGLTAGVFLLDVVSRVLTANPSEDTFFLNPEVSINVAVAATVVLLLSGLLAGLIPAWRAMQIKAIDAIREE